MLTLASVDPDILSLFAGALLSLLVSYVPGFKEKYAALSPEGKRLWMILFLGLVAAAVVGSVCATAGLFPNASCDQSGVAAVVKAFLLALAGNQATYLISPEAKRAQ